MELFDYLMAKKGHNTSARGDLFSYLLGKKASGGSGTYTTFSGTSLNISNTIKAAIKKFMLNSTELTQSGTPTPDAPQDIHVITGSNNIKITDGVEEQNYPISLGDLECCKIGDYADQIFKNTTDSEFYDSTLLENEWYLKKDINKVVLNGSENWASVGTFSGFYGYYLTLTNAIHIGQDASPLFKSDKFHYVNGTSQANEGGAYMVARNFLIFVTENTVSDLKTWLSNHNTIVYYILETPQYIHISQTDYPVLRSQLENLYNNAKSYNGQTNITQANDDLPFNISVDVKVLDTNLNMSNSLNSSLLNESTTETQNIAQSEEQTNLDDTNETEESVEEYQEL